MMKKQKRTQFSKTWQSIFHVFTLATSLGMTTSLMGQTDYTSTLPPDFMQFEEFEKDFALGGTSTEQVHAVTKSLSQVMHKSVIEGMRVLLDVDEEVIKGFELFLPTLEIYAPILGEKIKNGGRVFLIGSGSSGRVGVDIAAKCCLLFPNTGKQIRGIIGGGDSALIRAKEGFEDSEADGETALKDYHLGPQDTVILISASGSASFNVGCGNFSADRGSKVFYFYNSTKIPTRTKNLFDRKVNPTIPICIDIGPQAISGSTRLQGATLADACLGALLGSALYTSHDQELPAAEYPKDLLAKMKEGLVLIRKHLNSLGKFAEKEAEVFSDPRSNFRQLRDIGKQGYVTFLAFKDSIREVLIDSTETSPTFSTNPIRRESETHKKRAEFCPFLLGAGDNAEAWKALLGRDITPIDMKDTDSFLLSIEASGENSFQNRYIGKGNFVIGVMKLTQSPLLPEEMLNVLKAVKEQGGYVGVILLCHGTLAEEQRKELQQLSDNLVLMENVPQDPMGLSETLILKQTLNLISNGSMILTNKVHGNQMIDVRASNNKLIDRCIRLTKGIWSEYRSDSLPSDKILYHYIAHVSVLKKSYEKQGIYTPSVVKIVLAMLSLNKTPENFQEIIDRLETEQERVDWI
jgi:N-acetylmuramic acid 6-phosphate (MurNAc-6-P) etherase